MHTSSVLNHHDFKCYKSVEGEFREADFNQIFNEYHPQDRLGIISPCLEDGIINTAGTLLCITTHFYDHLRAKGLPFFNYPQHFALIGGKGDQIQTGMGSLKLNIGETGAPWGWLDVWPETNWIICPANASAMLDQVYRLQINRLMWPATLTGVADGNKLPDLTRRFLKNRLKSVFLYGSEKPNIRISTSKAASDIVSESIAKLPDSILDHNPDLTEDTEINYFESISNDCFLETMSVCFEGTDDIEMK